LSIEETTHSSARRPLAGRLRDALRDATGAVHERLHQQRSLAQVAAGTISPDAYGRLLRRLWGFHLAFEACARLKPMRTQWLEADLRALGQGSPNLSWPVCTTLGPYRDPLERLGGLYVVEGAALGGRQLASALDGLLGVDTIEGRRFFLGRGVRTGRAWREVLDELAGADDRRLWPAIIAGAQTTFACFEHWIEAGENGNA
jgi:heme oxygenase (biliverdin-IX-beta and delta-forming)